MRAKKAIMLRVLLNSFQKGSLEPYLRTLPEQLGQSIRELDIPSDDPKAALEQPINKIARIHYSWLEPHIKKLPKDVGEVMVESLPQPQRSRLFNNLGFSHPSKELSHLVKTYLIDELYQLLPGTQKVLPLEYLPKNGLSELAHWKKDELVELVSFLGLHDLAEDLRQIVDKKRLSLLYQCLNTKEQQYLRLCLQHRERISTPSLGLDRWSGSCEKLRSALQSRGLVRLGRALSGEHPDVLWHISHVFDRGRGQTLLKYFSTKKISGVTLILSQQVQNLMNILKKKSVTE